MDKLKAAVIGVGYLGRFHAQKYAAMEDVELIGVVDADAARAADVAAELGTAPYEDHRVILDSVDLVSIAVPTTSHFEVARSCLRAGVHILLEKPITRTVAEAESLIEEAKARDLVFQVGHLERFNEAVMALEGAIKNPMFVESHRLAQFRPRGTDVDVVLDLMIHDIDIILSIVPSAVSSVDSVGVPVLSDEVDIANARLRFDNGCVANVTASRVSRETLRKIRIFQPDSYITIDYQTKRISLFRKNGDGAPVPGLPNISMEEKTFESGDTLFAEIRSFVDSVKNGTPPLVSGEDGKRALELAHVITANLTGKPIEEG
ncbi:MAG: Gfo/Idh/MocA family oxidoreductase [bacterium]|nr:MAG: Gfo/Idh/MocA family oxidoreductase [bacterium]